MSSKVPTDEPSSFALWGVAGLVSFDGLPGADIGVAGDPEDWAKEGLAAAKAKINANEEYILGLIIKLYCTKLPLILQRCCMLIYICIAYLWFFIFSIPRFGTHIFQIMPDFQDMIPVMLRLVGETLGYGNFIPFIALNDRMCDYWMPTSAISRPSNGKTGHWCPMMDR